MLNKMARLNKLTDIMHPWLIKILGRDRLEYLASNTTNEVTRKIDSFIWTYHSKAKLVAVRQETLDTKTFVLLPNQYFKPAIAGQHIELTLNQPEFNETVSRCYTVSESLDDTISITVKHNPEGKVSDWLHRYAQEGMVFEISSPRGSFVYQEQDKLLYVCAGSGITPAFSMINDLLKNANHPAINLFYRTPSPEQTIFSKALLDIKSKINLVMSYSRYSNDRLTLTEQIERAYPDITQQTVYLCGPELFRQTVISYLESVDYDMNKLNVEQFTVSEESLLPGEQLNQDINVRLSSRNINFVIPAKDSGKSILEAAEDQGIRMEHGCRSGMCGSCKTNLVSGEVSGNKIGRSVYPCSAYPASPQLVLE